MKIDTVQQCGGEKSCDAIISIICDRVRKNGKLVRTYFVVRHLDDVFSYCTVDVKRFKVKGWKRRDLWDVQKRFQVTQEKNQGHEKVGRVKKFVKKEQKKKKKKQLEQGAIKFFPVALPRRAR